MKASESLEALRQINPRAEPDFDHSLEVAARAVRARLAGADTPRLEPRRRRTAWRRVALTSVAAAGLAVAVAAVTVGQLVGGPGVENATAAMRNAVALTSSSAERSGVAVVRITHDGKLWAGSTIRWNGGDLGVTNDAPRRQGRPGSEGLLVDGTLYGVEDGRWVVLGSPENIDPGSGTTPAETLAVVREDVGGVTLRRITDGMTAPTRRRRADGSTAYQGAISAGLIARETGFKEGRPIRLLPFGYVAHDEAADPTSLLDVAVTVGADGVVREIAVSWGTNESAWTYTVIYEGLGTTPALTAPANARPLRESGRGG